MHFQNYKLKITTGYNLVLLWNFAGNFKYKSGKRIAFAFYRIKCIRWQLHQAACITYHNTTLKNEIVIIEFSETCIFFIKFIFNITNDLFKNIFQGYYATCSSKLVNHN